MGQRVLSDRKTEVLQGTQAGLGTGSRVHGPALGKHLVSMPLCVTVLRAHELARKALWCMDPQGQRIRGPGFRGGSPINLLMSSLLAYKENAGIVLDQRFINPTVSLSQLRCCCKYRVSRPLPDPPGQNFMEGSQESVY